MASNKQAASRRKRFGTVRPLPSGKFQAFYTHKYVKVTAPRTFVYRKDANQWLLNEEVAISNGSWIEPSKRGKVAQNNMTLEKYLERYIVHQRRDGQPIRLSTGHLYRKLLKNQLSPLANVLLSDIDEETVSDWHHALSSNGKLTSTANAYKLLRAVMNMALKEKIILSNPCTIKGAQNASTQRLIYTPSLAEVHQLADRLSGDNRLIVLLATYGVMRFGEVAGLQRRDFRLDAQAAPKPMFDVHIQRQVQYFGGAFHVTPPKSKEGVRTTPLSPAITDELTVKLSTLKRAEDYLFTHPNTGHIRNDHFERVLRAELKKMGMDGLGWTIHSFRRAGATAYANSGANSAEIQGVLGDASVTAALRYVQKTGRAKQLAASL